MENLLYIWRVWNGQIRTKVAIWCDILTLSHRYRSVANYLHLSLLHCHPHSACRDDKSRKKEILSVVQKSIEVLNLTVALLFTIPLWF